MHKDNFEKFSFLLLILILVILSASNALGDTTIAKLAPVKYAVLNEYLPGRVFMPLDLYVGTFNAGGSTKKARSLVLFDISKIRGEIVNAYLEINVNFEKKYASYIYRENYEIEALKAAQAWEKAKWSDGNFLEQDRIGAVTLGDVGQYNIQGLASLAINWRASPETNYGLLLKGTSESGEILKQIDSIALVIEYEESNDCMKNEGVCRSSCNGDERQADYSCGFLGTFRINKCCINIPSKGAGEAGGEGVGASADECSDEKLLGWFGQHSGLLDKNGDSFERQRREIENKINGCCKEITSRYC